MYNTKTSILFLSPTNFNVIPRLQGEIAENAECFGIPCFLRLFCGLCGNTSVARVILSIALLFTVETQLIASAPTDSFLSHGPGVASYGYGEAVTAVPSDVSVMYYNPSLLSLLNGKREIVVQYTPLLDNTLWYGFIGGRTNIKKISFSVSVLQLQSSEMDLRGTVLSQPTMVFINNTAMYTTLSFPVGYAFTVGANVKFISSSLAGYSFSTNDVDTGLSYTYTFLDLPFFYKPTLRLGASIQNVFQSKFAFRVFGDEETLLAVYRVGLSFSGVIPEIYTFSETGTPKENKITVSTDLKFISTINKIYPCFGSEFVYHDFVAIRVGMTSSYYLTLGAGIILPLSNTRFGIDYSYEISKLLPVHRISLKCTF